MKPKLEELKVGFLAALDNVKDDQGLEELRVEYLGRKGKLGDILKGLKDLSVEEKKDIGAFANTVKAELESVFKRKQAELAHELAGAKAQDEWIDVTAPGIAPEPLGG